jgi:hypothetical protein
LITSLKIKFFSQQIAKDSVIYKRDHDLQQPKKSIETHSVIDFDNCDTEAQTSQQTVCYKLFNCHNSSNHKKHSNDEQREKKVAKTLIIITSVFLLCWSPFFISYLIYIKDELTHLNNIVIWLGLCNSALNPIIYAYFIPTFRSTFKKILFKK